ncbi:response regulator transcription factor [Beijerinckia indica]|uniref:Two component transcriptional regulator, winged helix family n=1 Tax=Beijerinckia indica subsp. indica (strain ATCC 9039 / DSM 1715 / NCIMB 8712) TaxID=395963 RepID=B2IFK7_BEII9|nr:response regulator transcription factor [Beijerinckia indica]ACB97103.1 two component transcriptional regulator, winged helix family [Beijerinckia indica subsp. indica ATCC 9039]
MTLQPSNTASTTPETTPSGPASQPATPPASTPASQASPAVPADDAAHLLIVDDDRRIRALLARFLADQGYRVTTAGNAEEATASLRNFAFDLIVLDAMMPGENGFDLLTRLRAQPSDLAHVPVLMLTACTEPEDRVRGFEAGSDDYLGKPYEPRELALRIASILRRAQPRAVSGPVTQVRFGDFTFDLERGELQQGGEIVRLTERERDMLRLLAENAGEIVSREALAGLGIGGNERTVDVQVNRLRRKIERDLANPLHLQTARGAGYRLLVDR